MVKCTRCYDHPRMKRWKNIVKEDSITIAWKCTCGAFKTTRRGKHTSDFKYHTDEAFREEYRKRQREYMRKHRERMRKK